MKFRFIIFIIWISIPFQITAQTVTVRWAANSEEDLAGYYLYYGHRPRQYSHRLETGNVTSYTFPAFKDTGMIYLSLTAFDSTGNESLYSKEVSFYILPHHLRGEGFELMPNHPNPFNPVTVIPYRIRETACVKLAIYDVLGREIDVLIDEEKIPGDYHARWEGRHRDGGELANGIYFCRLIVGEFYHTRKLMFLK